jgi:hypothetical protein
MRKFWYLTAAVGAALLTTMIAGPAYATSAVLTSGSLGGPATSGTVSSGLKTGNVATFFEPGTTTGVTCSTSSLGGTVGTNPTAPGTATLTGSNLTFASCTENIAGAIGVKSLATTNSPYTSSVSSSGAVSVSGPINAQVVLNTILGTITCTYTAASVNGTALNGDNSITFANQRFTKVTGPSTCFGSIDFSGIYAPIKDGVGALVFVN